MSPRNKHFRRKFKRRFHHNDDQKRVDKFRKSEDTKLNQAERFVPRNDRQSEYRRAIMENDIIYCTGPAGTGKTAVAIATASQYLIRGEFTKMIVSRPCVETAPKSLGALPGDLRAKFDPYLKGVKRELKKFLGDYHFHKFTNENVIEFLPLEFMRGETYDNAIQLLDEAQNCTKEQLDMFFTRAGENTKVLINGDISQYDLGIKSIKHDYDTDLEFIISRVGRLPGFAHIQFEIKHIVRNPRLMQYLEAFLEKR